MNANRYRVAPARPTLGGRQGFTLIETAVAVVLVGLGVTALLVSTASGTRANDAGKKLSDATFLAQEIREWTLRIPFTDPDESDPLPGPDGSDPQTFIDDLDDLLGFDGAGVTYDPPRNANCTQIPSNYIGQAISDMDGWSQHVNLTWRDPDDLRSIVAHGSSDVIYVEVAVSWQGQEMVRTGWLVIRKD